MTMQERFNTRISAEIEVHAGTSRDEMPGVAEPIEVAFRAFNRAGQLRVRMNLAEARSLGASLLRMAGVGNG